jgi:hypothetical protein
MAANIFVFLFCCLLAGLLYHFRLRKAATRAEVGRLALVCASIGIFFLANALFAYLGRGALLAAINTSPILSMKELEDVGTGVEVILDGTVSPDNPVRMASYVAYAGFVATARHKMIYPNLMLIANLVAVAAVVLLPWASWYLRHPQP